MSATPGSGSAGHSGIAAHVETRAGLGGKFTVAVDRGVGITLFQLRHKATERFALLWSAGVLRTHQAIASAHVTHPDGVSVVSAAMCSCDMFRTSGTDRAVQTYQIVVAYTVVTLPAMPAVDLFDVHFAPLGRG